MARINLLPWREERRRERKQQFLLNAGIAAACAVAAIGLVHVVYQNIIDYQTARNGYLESEIKKLDKTIAEIRDLEKEKQRLVDRMRAIETLQTSRPIIVHIFDELVSTLPEGISLTEITQSSNAITIKGIAESNARVSNFMRNVEASKWVKKPQLNIIETKDEKGRRINNFTLIIEQISAQPESGETGADAKGSKVMNWSEFKNLDPNNIGNWPAPAKAAVIGFGCAVLLGLGWYLAINDQRLLLEQVEGKEITLKQDIEAKQSKVVNLDALKEQLQDIKQSFGDMLKRLPNKTEVAALLVDISQQGLGAGLEFELFKPGSEQPAEFYVELPINIRVTGSYHQLGQFVSGVADLPRIVTQHDIKIKAKDKGGLIMESIAKTYRYLGEEEEAAQQPQTPNPTATKPSQS